MTNSYSFRPQAQPVNTFVAPSTVAPATGFDQLVNALKTVNPAINQYFDSRIKEEIEEEKIEGIQIAEEQAKQGFKKLTSTIRKKDGDEVARQLVGGSIFAQSAYEKHKARLLGQSIESEITNLYQTKTFPTINEDGEEIQTPLHHFPGDSPEYQEFIKEAAELGAGGLQGIRDKNIIEHFSPYQQKAFQTITKHHLKQHNEFRFSRTKNQATGTLLAAFLKSKGGNQPEALNDIEEWVQDNVVLGLPSDKQTKFWPSLIDSGKSIAAQIYAETGNINDAQEFIKMFGNIKYGPREKQKNGKYKQRTLKEHPKFGTLMFEQSRKLWKAFKEDEDRRADQEKAAEEFTIKGLILKYGKKSTGEEGKDMLERIVELFPDRKEFILERIELAEADRTPAFKALAGAVLSGDYDNNPSQLYADLAQIRRDIGEATFTDEDEKNYEIVFDAMERRRKGDYADLNRDIRGVLQRIAGELGADDPENLGWGAGKTESEDAQEFRKIQRALPRAFKDFLQFTPDPNDPTRMLNRSQLEYETELRRLEDFYIDEFIPKIKKYREKQKPLGKKIIKPNKPGEGTAKEKEKEEGFVGKLFSSATPGGTSPVAAGTLEEAGIKPNVDPGGLAELIRGGESSGRYNVYNTGTTDSTGKMDITSMTIADVEKMQQEGKVFAVGAYQFTPGVLTEARIYSNIDKDAIMTPIVQDRLVLGMLLDGRKRPNFADYVKGKSDNINAAHLDLAKEFAAIQGPDGKGYYDNDKAGNFANVPAEKVRKALIEARKTISGK